MPPALNTLASLLFVLELLLLLTGLGLLLRQPGKDEDWLNSHAVLPASGLATLGILSTLLYRAGLPARLILWLLLGAACLGWARKGQEAWQNRQVKSAATRRPSPALLLLLAATLILLIAPALRGGAGFTIHRGNPYDGSNYLESAATYAVHPFPVLTNTAPVDLERQGIPFYAKLNLAIRPTVAIAYAVLSWLQPSGFVGNHYLFLATTLLAAALALLPLCRLLAPGSPLALHGSFAAMAVVGFWGQYVLDIDAWSEVASLPLLILVLGGLLGSRSISPAILAWGWLGLFYYYPECWAFTLPALAGVACLRLAATWRRSGTFPTPDRLVLAVWALLLGLMLVVWDSHITLFVHQSSQAGAGLDWWRYYDAYLLGLDGANTSLFANLADGCGGLLGVYFLTPAADAPALTAALQRGLLLSLPLFAMLALGLAFRRKVLPREPVACFLLFTGVVVLELICLSLLGQYWTAGKGWSMVALLSGAACCLAWEQALPPLRSALRIGLCALALCHLGFAFDRLLTATEGARARPSAPYPYYGILHQLIDYDDLDWMKGLSKDDVIAVKIESQWLESFARCHLVRAGLFHYTEGPLRNVSKRTKEEIRLRDMPRPTVRLIDEIDPRNPGRLKLVQQRLP